MMKRRVLTVFFAVDAVLLGVLVVVLIVAGARSRGQATTAAQPKRCASSDLTAAYARAPRLPSGTSYENWYVDLTNISQADCSLDGFPEIYLSAAGTQAKSPTRQNIERGSRTVTLARGDTARVTVAFSGGLRKVGNFPQCIAAADQVKVYVDNDRAPLTLPAPDVPSLTCAEAATTYVKR